MSKDSFFCCNTKIKISDVWFLKDIKDFTGRKLFIGKCPRCSDDVAVLIEERISDHKEFSNKIKGIKAVKTIYREKKRRVLTIPNVENQRIYDWVYGVNKEIRNRNGKVTEIRQYASDFKGNKKLIKTIINT